VLDVKFRSFPALAPALPWGARLLGFLHGMYYVRSAVAILGIAILALMLLTGDAPSLLSPGLFPPLSAMWIALALTDIYRQRFFLDGRREWGVHWRAAVLGLAKWPYFVLALGDALRGFSGPYAITRKIRDESVHHMLLVPHALIAGVVAAAWAASVLLRRPPNLVVELGSALALIGSLGVMLTERVTFPPPYDRGLATSWRRQSVEPTSTPER
jgi:hypothetical protein